MPREARGRDSHDHDCRRHDDENQSFTVELEDTNEDNGTITLKIGGKRLVISKEVLDVFRAAPAAPAVEEAQVKEEAPAPAPVEVPVANTAPVPEAPAANTAPAI
jgi:hypothetical protein